jgi:hypothetical protein
MSWRSGFDDWGLQLGACLARAVAAGVARVRCGRWWLQRAGIWHSTAAACVQKPGWGPVCVLFDFAEQQCMTTHHAICSALRHYAVQLGSGMWGDTHGFVPGRADAARCPRGGAQARTMCGARCEAVFDHLNTVGVIAV